MLEEAEAAVAAARREAAPRLAGQIQTTLRELAMPSARFSIAVEGTGPADQVTFLLGANAGEPPQPLAKAASGGELARTMLAIRLAITDIQGVMVFDEVDAGVGGAAATAVGAALADLGHHAQVLVVTHLAQVAAQADHQVEVRKSERAGRTRTEVAGARHRRPGGRAQPDAVGQPGQRVGATSRPRSCSIASRTRSHRGDHGAVPDAGSARHDRSVPLASSGARHGRPAATLRGTSDGRPTPPHQRRRSHGGNGAGRPDPGAHQVHLLHRRGVVVPGQGPHRLVTRPPAQVPRACGSPCASSTRTSTSTRAR